MNQQLTARQQKLITTTEEVGNLTPVVFAKNVLNYTKIKFLTKEDVGPSLGAIFQNIALLSGVKEEISQINKLDIKKMIVAHYGSLSLEEIVYAFELERYGKLPPKTDHFQLINAEYVAKILGKYKAWLSKTRFDNNLPLSLKKAAEPQISEEEKKQIIENGCLRCFDEYKTTGLIKEGNSHIYDYLFDDIKIHEFTVAEKNAAIKIAKEELRAQAKTLNRTKAKDVLRSLESNLSGPVINQAKRLLLKNYFNSLGNKHLKEKL